VHVLVLTIEWSYYLHGTNTIKTVTSFNTLAVRLYVENRMVLTSRLYYDAIFPYSTLCTVRTGSLKNAKYLRNTGSVGWVSGICWPIPPASRLLLIALFSHFLRFELWPPGCKCVRISVHVRVCLEGSGMGS